jgi:hypothetical protein
MKPRYFLLSLAVLGAAASFLSPQMQAQTCLNSDYRGVFSALVVGDFLQPPPGFPPGPNARLGRVEADGNGNASIHAILSFNGAIFTEDYQGLYTVNRDCTMDVTLFVPFPGFPDPIPFLFSGMLVDHYREVALLLRNPPGTTFRILLRKQPKNFCTNNDLKGSYVLNMSGANVFVPYLPPGPAARVGKVTFDGAGAFKATTHASYAGSIVEENFSGTYAVDAKCLFTMSYELEEPYMLTGMLKDNSEGAHLIQNQPQGMVITGTLTHE